MKPLVSIVIPFYNCPYIEQAIVSALGQTYPHIEIIVIDDGSSIHADKISPFMTRVLYLGKANGWTASALNYGIRAASGQYITWLSSDDMFYPDKVEQQVNFMMERDAAISHTSFDAIDAYNNITGRDVTPRYPNRSEWLRALAFGNPINGCTVMMRRDFFDRFGLFNEGFPYTHDYELWMRAAVQSAHMHFLAAPLTMYRVHGDMGTRKHWPVIEKEIERVQQLYRPGLLDFAARLGG